MVALTTERGRPYLDPLALVAVTVAVLTLAALALVPPSSRSTAGSCPAALSPLKEMDRSAC